jgi:hypothetical protein
MLLSDEVMDTIDAALQGREEPSSLLVMMQIPTFVLHIFFNRVVHSIIRSALWPRSEVP